jgi:hypothetical protein
MEAHLALNHLNLTVPDVPQTRALFETYFGFRRLAGAPESDNFVVLTDESGFVLSLNNFTEAEEVANPGPFTSASGKAAGIRWTRSTSGSRPAAST